MGLGHFLSAQPICILMQSKENLHIVQIEMDHIQMIQMNNVLPYSDTIIECYAVWFIVVFLIFIVISFNGLS